MPFLGGRCHFPRGAARPVSRRQRRAKSSRIRIDIGMRLCGFLYSVLLLEIRTERRPGRRAIQWGSSIPAQSLPMCHGHRPTCPETRPAEYAMIRMGHIWSPRPAPSVARKRLINTISIAVIKFGLRSPVDQAG